MAVPARTEEGSSIDVYVFDMDSRGAITGEYKELGGSGHGTYTLGEGELYWQNISAQPVNLTDLLQEKGYAGLNFVSANASGVLLGACFGSDEYLVLYPKEQK